MHSAVYAVTSCIHLNCWVDRAGFRRRHFRQLVLHYVIKEFRYLEKLRVLSSGAFCRIQNVADFSVFFVTHCTSAVSSIDNQARPSVSLSLWASTIDNGLHAPAHSRLFHAFPAPVVLVLCVVFTLACVGGPVKIYAADKA